MASMKVEPAKKMATTMKAVRFYKYGGPDILVYEDVPRPSISDDEALVCVYAAGVNPVDWKVRAGYVKELFRVELPMTSGVDVSGVIEMTGNGVKGFERGDPVYGYLGVTRNGSYAENVATKAAYLAPKPGSLDFIHAAAAPLVSLVAWQTLVDIADLSPGQAVLIHGASGGVGHMAVQVAKWRGARVIGTASARHTDFVKNLGADEVIDYRRMKFEDIVDDVDVVLDLIGGDTQERSWQVLKKGGMLISTLGIMHPEKEKEYGVRAVSYMSRPSGEDLRKIGELFDAGKLTIDVTTVLPMSEARKAHELSQTGHVQGKIVLKVGDVQ
jgi:NADPH:quinone reductase-like Zn-dependent oxidoreductase